jgi:hypothetical protein
VKRQLAVVVIQPAGRDCWVVVPSEKADRVAWAALHAEGDEGDRAAAAAAFLDRLREAHGIEPCAELRLWAECQLRWHGRCLTRRIAARAEDLVLDTLPPANVVKLRELAGEIAAVHAQTLQLYRQTVEHARRVGSLLREVKRLVGHGNWLRWASKNLPFTPRMAQKYLEVAENWNELEAWANANSGSHLTMAAGLAWLRQERDERDDPDPLPSGPADVPRLLAATAAGAGGAAAAQAAALQTAYARATNEAAEHAQRAKHLEAEIDHRRQEQRGAEQTQRAARLRAEWEARFDLDAATAELRGELENLCDGWPAGRRHQFLAAVRAVADALEEAAG